MSEARLAELAKQVKHSPECILGMDDWDQALYTESEKTCSCDRDERLVLAGIESGLPADWREVLAVGYQVLSSRGYGGSHQAECATSCAPAEVPGPCDCDQVLSARAVWAEPKLAYIYVLAEALADKMEDGSTERGLVREAMSKIELADTYVEKRNRERT